MATAELAHLHPTARALAQLDDEQRIRSLQRERWIDYPRASEALARLERLLQTPERDRMPCMVMHGPSNIGKSLIIAKFLREHPPSFDRQRGIQRRSAIAMQMPPTPDQRRFYRALLFEVGAPQASSATLATLETLARDILRRVAPRMLIVDEVHHLLAGSHLEQRGSLKPAQVPGQRPQGQRRRRRNKRRPGGISERRADEQPLHALRDLALERERRLQAAATRLRAGPAAQTPIRSGAAVDRAVPRRRQHGPARRGFQVTQSGGGSGHS